MSKARKICVLGAGGAIGGQLVGHLVTEGYQVTAVVRRLASAVRVGRYPVSIIELDLLDCSVNRLRDIINGHDSVIDCTYSSSLPYSERIKDSEKLADLICSASTQENIRHLVHYGTISVYPSTAKNVSEETACQMIGESYADAKLTAEKIFLSQPVGGPAVTVLQLPVVYGPFMAWTATPVRQMLNTTLMLPDDLAGICTPIHVDDVVRATCMVIENKSQWVDKFLLSGLEEMSWAEYYSAYAELSGQLAIELVSRSQVNDLLESRAKGNRPWQKLKSKFSNDTDFRQLVLSQWGVRAVYQGLKKIAGQQGVDQLKDRLVKHTAAQTGTPVSVLDKNTLAVFDSMPSIDSQKAQQVLGFQAQVSFAEGVGKSGAWLRWAQLIK